MKDEKCLELIKANAGKLGLAAGSLKREQAIALRFLAHREIDSKDSKALLGLFGSRLFGNDSALRQWIDKEVHKVEGKVKKADSAAALLAEMGIDAEEEE